MGKRDKKVAWNKRCICLLRAIEHLASKAQGYVGNCTKEKN